MLNLKVENLGNGLTQVGGERIGKFCILTDRLNDVKDHETKISKAASKIWRKDYNSPASYFMDYRKFFYVIKREVLKILNEIDPETANRKLNFLIERGCQLENTKKSGLYYIFLLALDYLDGLDDFINTHKEEWEAYLK